jgi:hypothetical protein
MSGETWTAQVTVTVHGIWNPKDEQACADLIRTVNRLRSSDNLRPTIRRGWWSNDDEPWLDVKIDHTSMRIDAGYHLVSLVLPDGSTVWEPLDDDDLAKLRSTLVAVP